METISDAILPILWDYRHIYVFLGFYVILAIYRCYKVVDRYYVNKDLVELQKYKENIRKKIQKYNQKMSIINMLSSDFILN